jgi:hypothetical protein
MTQGHPLASLAAMSRGSRSDGALFLATYMPVRAILQMERMPGRWPYSNTPAE